MKYFLTLIFLLNLISCQSPTTQKNLANWTHYSIDGSLPGEAWGTGGPTLADYDGDGDLDLALSRRTVKSAFWYERKNDSTWVRHLIGTDDGLENTLGTAACDIDHDGSVDIVFSKVWFKNPGNLMIDVDAAWIPVSYNGHGHDIINADVDGNGTEDVVIYNGKTLSWFDTSKEMEETIISEGHDDHGGTAPRGVGDLDGDMDVDIVIPGYWFENNGASENNWIRHEWPFVPVENASYGRSIRSWIVDIDGDGINDIVYSHCDTGNSHVYWVQNKGKGQSWVSHQLPDPPTRQGDVPGTGSFHSLGVADFDLDGDLEIFAGEQEDPDVYMVENGLLPMRPVGLKERGVIWENNGAKTPEFTPVVIHLDNPGWHDTSLGDVDGDGDIDLATKVWNADGPNYHADYWRNDIQ